MVDNIKWTVDLIERLRGLASAGLSAREIGDVMHISRQAVIGKCHRVGIQLKGRVSGRKSKKDPVRPRPKKPFQPLTFGKYGQLLLNGGVVTPPTRVEPPPVLLEEILAQAVDFDAFDPAVHCAWPVSDTPFKFCGGTLRHGRYCAHHHERSLGKTERKKAG